MCQKSGPVKVKGQASVRAKERKLQIVVKKALERCVKGAAWRSATALDVGEE